MISPFLVPTARSPDLMCNSSLSHLTRSSYIKGNEKCSNYGRKEENGIKYKSLLDMEKSSTMVGYD